jgi:hypothetical protein
MKSALPQATSAAAPLDIHQALVRAHAHWNAGQADQAQWPGQSDALHLLGLTAHLRPLLEELGVSG